MLPKRSSSSDCLRSKTRARLACQQDPLWRIHGRNNNPEPPATLPPGASTAGVAAQRRNKKMQMPAKKEQKESVQKKHLMLLWRPRDYQWCPSFRPPRLPRGNKKMKMEASSDRGATRMKRTHVVHPPGTSPCMTLLDSCLHEKIGRVTAATDDGPPVGLLGGTLWEDPAAEKQLSGAFLSCVH